MGTIDRSAARILNSIKHLKDFDNPAKKLGSHSTEKTAKNLRPAIEFMLKSGIRAEDIVSGNPHR